MIYIVLFFSSLLLTYIIYRISLKRSWLAKVTERSSHTVATPHGGGIAIALTWFFSLLYLFKYNMIDPSLFYALMCGSLLSLVSYFDDLYELSPKIRLFVQAAVSIMGLYALGGLAKIDFGLFTIENQLATNGVAFIVIMWFINLYNFLDGIDGYAGSEAVFLGLAGFILMGGEHFLFLIVSVLGFLVWNWHKAKIFMGDVGSTLLGYIVAVFTLYYQNSGVSLFVWIILFGLFWFDATLTLWRRYKNKEKLFKAHRKHAYQRIVQSGKKHDHVVLLGMCINFILFILGYSALYFKDLMIVCFFVSLIVLYCIILWVDQKKKFDTCL